MRAALALGSNLPSSFGNPAANLQEALHRLKALGQILAVSSFYQTKPVGMVEQPDFTNAAALLGTALGPLELLHQLLQIEASMGRSRSADDPPKGPRIIDLDLLLCENDARQGFILNDPDLVLPHPELHRRLFVLEPLAEIAPAMLNPTSRLTVSDMLKKLR